MKKSICKSSTIIFLFLIFIACSRYSIDKLLSAPEKIEIDGREYILESSLERNFMPPSPPSGLFGSIYVIALDSLEFPSSLDADHCWIIKGNDVWDTDLKNPEIPSHEIYMLRKVFVEEGPDWETKIYVNVVVEVTTDDDSSYMLRADSQYIHELW